MTKIHTDKFFFYSGSADRPPGLGTHEFANPADYVPLNAIPDWRKILSNFWHAEFAF